MDAIDFDAITRRLSSNLSRRRTLGLLTCLGLPNLLALDVAAANKKPCPPCKKRKKGKCKKKLPNGTACAGGTCQGGSCVTSPPRPTCSDRVKNGSETDVDCGGGSCPRCVTGKTCFVENDCSSGACPNGVCVACTPLQLCGSDARGACHCHQAFPSNEPVCDSGQMLNEFTVDNCAKCPAGTETCVTINGGLLFNCFKRCGSP